MKKLFKLSIVILILSFNLTAVAQKKEIVHNIYSAFLPHLGDSICRLEGYNILKKDPLFSEKSLNNKKNLWRNYKKQCSNDGSYELILSDLYGFYGHHKEARQILEHSITTVDYDTRYHKLWLQRYYLKFGEIEKVKKSSEEMMEI